MIGDSLAIKYKKICKDEIDYQIISLRLERLSVNEIAKRLECHKSTVSRRLERLKKCGFEDPFDIAKDAKKESLKIGRIGETAVAYVLERMGIKYEWTGKKIGKYPDLKVYYDRKRRKSKVIVCELKNRKRGAYLTKAEVERDVLPRFEGYDNHIKVLLITSGVTIDDEARELLKESSIRVVRIGEQIKDFEPLTLWRLYFRLKRVRSLPKGWLNSELATKRKYLISDDLFELLIMTHGAIEKCNGGVYYEGG